MYVAVRVVSGPACAVSNYGPYLRLYGADGSLLAEGGHTTLEKLFAPWSTGQPGDQFAFEFSVLGSCDSAHHPRSTVRRIDIFAEGSEDPSVSPVSIGVPSVPTHCMNTSASRQMIIGNSTLTSRPAQRP